MSIIGLDIGEHSLKAIEIEKKKDGLEIINFGFFENNLINRTKLSMNKDFHSNAIKNFFNEFNFSTPNVILGINDANIFMRVLKLPKMSDSDLENTIKYEAEKYIPIPVDKVNITYQKVKNISSQSITSVQVIAAKKDIINSMVDVVKKSNLVPYAIEPETLAVSRALQTKDDNTGSIILDIGYSYSVVIVCYNNVVHFTRTIPFGGDHITRELQQKLNIEYYQAEEYKKTYGINTSYFDGKLLEIIKPVLDNILLEVERALLFFSKENKEIAIKKAILTGGSSMLPGLLIYLVEQLGIEVIMGDPLKNLTINESLENRKSSLIDSANFYTTCIGLALKVK